MNGLRLRYNELLVKLCKLFDPYCMAHTLQYISTCVASTASPFIIPHIHKHNYYTNSILHCNKVALTYMQFLAAKSLCTKRLEERYSIPLATSRHIFVSKLRVRPCVRIYNNLYVFECT